MTLNIDTGLFSPSITETILKVAGKIGEREARQAAFFAQMIPVKSAQDDLHNLLLLLLACRRKGTVYAGTREFADLFTGCSSSELFDVLSIEGVSETIALFLADAKKEQFQQFVDEWFFCLLNEEKNGNLLPLVQSDDSVVNDRLPLVFCDRERQLFCFHADFKSEQLLREKLPPLFEFSDEPLDSRNALTVVQKAIDTAFFNRTPDVRQIAGVLLALNTRLVIIAGGPGTGKTTVLHAAARAVADYHHISTDKIILCAPNGRAKEHLCETVLAGCEKEDPFSNCNAQTLHALLGLSIEEQFNYPSGEVLPYRLIIVDQVSMVDLKLFAALIDRLHPDCRLVLAGNMEPLFSDDTGPVLGDLTLPLSGEPGMGSLSDAVVDEMKEIIKKMSRVGSMYELGQMRTGSPSSLVDRVVFLTRNFRCDPHITEWWERRSGLKTDDEIPECVAAPVSIIEYIRKFHMNTGNGPIENYTGWLSIWMENWWVQVYDQWRRYFRPMLLQGDVNSKIEADGFCNLMERMCIVCCTRDGNFGRIATNRYCSDVHWQMKKNNREEPDWHDGQPIIIRNDQYGGEDLYCGDTGMVLEKNGEYFGCFAQRSRIVTIPLEQLDDVETAYVLSVGKTQRSEFREIMFVVPEDPEVQLTRQLVYAGITRAKKRMTIIDPGDRLVDISKLPVIRRKGILKGILR